MSLFQLALDIREALLHLPLTRRGRDPIRLADRLPTAARIDRRKQRRRWRPLPPTRADAPRPPAPPTARGSPPSARVASGPPGQGPTLANDARPRPIGARHNITPPGPPMPPLPRPLARAWRFIMPLHFLI